MHVSCASLGDMVSGGHGGSLELGLYLVVRRHVGAGT